MINCVCVCVCPCKHTKMYAGIYMQIYVCAYLWKPEINLWYSCSCTICLFRISLGHGDCWLDPDLGPGIYLSLPPSTTVTNVHHCAFKTEKEKNHIPMSNGDQTRPSCSHNKQFANWAVSPASGEGFLTAPSRAVPELLDSSVCQPGRVSIPPGKESCLGPPATVHAEKNIQEFTAQLCPFSQEVKKKAKHTSPKKKLPESHSLPNVEYMEVKHILPQESSLQAWLLHNIEELQPRKICSMRVSLEFSSRDFFPRSESLYPEEWSPESPV